MLSSLYNCLSHNIMTICLQLNSSHFFWPNSPEGMDCPRYAVVSGTMRLMADLLSPLSYEKRCPQIRLASSAHPTDVCLDFGHLKLVIAFLKLFLNHMWSLAGCVILLIGATAIRIQFPWSVTMSREVMHVKITWMAGPKVSQQNVVESTTLLLLIGLLPMVHPGTCAPTYATNCSVLCALYLPIWTILIFFQQFELQ